MPTETRILDAIEGDIRCTFCGRFVKIGEGKTLGYWTSRGTFLLVCLNCEKDPRWLEAIANKEQERV